jgi:hypothetical protein
MVSRGWSFVPRFPPTKPGTLGVVNPLPRLTQVGTDRWAVRRALLLRVSPRRGVWNRRTGDGGDAAPPYRVSAGSRSFCKIPPSHKSLESSDLHREFRGVCFGGGSVVLGFLSLFTATPGLLRSFNLADGRLPHPELNPVGVREDARTISTRAGRRRAWRPLPQGPRSGRRSQETA